MPCFQKRTTFQDSLFYDISAWTFPLAFNLDYEENETINRQVRRSSLTDLENEFSITFLQILIMRI